MPIHVYQYAKCSTCRKALKWLADHDIAIEKSDLVAHPPNARALADLHQRSGLSIMRFFNTSGESYRAGNWKERLKTTSQSAAIAALAADGKLIKRPIIDTGHSVLVGFDEAAYQSAFHLKRS